MSTVFAIDLVLTVSGQVPYPSERGRFNPASGMVLGKSRLATDAVGSFTMTLRNAVVGSRYRIERSGDGSLATPTGNAEGTVPGVSGVADVSITLDLYAAGNTNNDLKIKVRKGTAAPKYQPFETQATAQAGTVASYIAQAPDLIA